MKYRLYIYIIILKFSLIFSWNGYSGCNLSGLNGEVENKFKKHSPTGHINSQLASVFGEFRIDMLAKKAEITSLTKDFKKDNRDFSSSIERRTIENTIQADIAKEEKFLSRFAYGNIETQINYQSNHFNKKIFLYKNSVKDISKRLEDKKLLNSCHSLCKSSIDISIRTKCLSKELTQYFEGKKFWTHKCFKTVIGRLKAIQYDHPDSFTLTKLFNTRNFSTVPPIYEDVE